MKKQSQSLLDFINFLPLQSLSVQADVLTSKESDSLMDIWNSDRYGTDTVVLSESVDPLQVASLTSKGLIENKFATTPKSAYYRSVGITEKGKEIITNIILRNEKSAFDKSSSSGAMQKIASSNPQLPNWLQKIWKLP